MSIQEHFESPVLESIEEVPDIPFNKDSFCDQGLERLSHCMDINNEEFHPKVFISYSWDDKEHEDWVENLANKLMDSGIDVLLDRWEIKLGSLLPHFMEDSIANSDRVICVMTPNYKKKTDKLDGGVGFEYSINDYQMFYLMCFTMAQG